MSSLLRLERKQTNSSNAFRIRIFLFRSYSFGIETITAFIHSRSSLENHTRFQTKITNVYTRFQTKTRKNPTRWCSTYLYGLYKGVLPPTVAKGREGGGGGNCQYTALDRIRTVVNSGKMQRGMNNSVSLVYKKERFFRINYNLKLFILRISIYNRARLS